MKEAEGRSLILPSAAFTPFWWENILWLIWDVVQDIIPLRRIKYTHRSTFFIARMILPSTIFFNLITLNFEP